MGLKKKVLVSITGRTKKDWISKLKEIKRYNLKRIAVFTEMLPKSQRRELYYSLLDSSIKEIPLVHIKNDFSPDELRFFKKKFHTKCFTIHESSFNVLHYWKGYYPNLFLEMNKDSRIAPNVDVSKIGGFCIDLSHFKVEEEAFTKEFEYIIKRKKIYRYFRCNHLNGYNYKTNSDAHTIKSLKQFEYLKTLPRFVFGKYIALETFNPISQQLKFKEHVIKLLS